MVVFYKLINQFLTKAIKIESNSDVVNADLIQKEVGHHKKLNFDLLFMSGGKRQKTQFVFLLYETLNQRL